LPKIKRPGAFFAKIPSARLGNALPGGSPARILSAAAALETKKKSRIQNEYSFDVQTSLRKDGQENAILLIFNPGIAGFAARRTKIVGFSSVAALQASFGARQGCFK
jgi:hypothetical protein